MYVISVNMCYTSKIDENGLIVYSAVWDGPEMRFQLIKKSELPYIKLTTERDLEDLYG